MSLCREHTRFQKGTRPLAVLSFAIQKGCEMDDDDDGCASVPAENPEDLTDEEGDLDWNWIVAF
jgi:hypothetical protein